VAIIPRRSFVTTDIRGNIDELAMPVPEGSGELTEERETHIREKHLELLPQYRDQIDQTLADPDEVRKDARFPNSLLFSHWFPDVKAVGLLSWWWSPIHLQQVGIGS
jgi:hypothetical protein